MRRRCSSAGSRRNVAIMMMAATPIGRLTQNTSCQLTCSTRKAPSNGPKHRGDAEHAGHQPLHVRALGRRVDVAEDRGGDRLHAAGAEALQRAEQDQRQHVAGEAAQRGTDQEQAGADIEHLLAAVDVGKPAVDRNAHRLGQQIDREHPGEQIEPTEIGNDRRHRGGDDGAFHRRHECRHQAGGEHQRAASRGRVRDMDLRRWWAGTPRRAPAGLVMVGTSRAFCHRDRGWQPARGQPCRAIQASNHAWRRTAPRMPNPAPAVDIGVDIGGTFTDIVCRRAGEPMRTLKIPPRAAIPARRC